MTVYNEKNIELHVRRLLGRISKREMIPETIKIHIDEARNLKERRKTIIKETKQLKRRFKQTSDTYIRKAIEASEYKLESVTDSIENNKEEIDKAISDYSSDLLRKIRNKSNIVKLDDFMMNDKRIFKSSNLETEILLSLVSEEIRHYYKCIPADRNVIVNQIKSLLDNKMPKFIIRADVKSCFENVPFKTVLDKLEDNGYLSNISIKLLKEVYRHLNVRNIEGVPRGLSCSSYLVEVYFQDLDRMVKLLPGVYFYKRYVDDIILMLHSNVKNDFTDPDEYLGDYWISLKKIFSDNKLSLHEKDAKKKLIFYEGNSVQKFDYLGYKFLMGIGGLEVRLSSSKLRKYLDRIDGIIGYYNKTAKDNQSDGWRGERNRRSREQPLRRLMGQLSALTGNGSLTGMKSKVFAGIYYSNQHLTSVADFRILDKILVKKIDSALSIPENLFAYDSDADSIKTTETIKEILKRWTFERGFVDKRFCKGSKYCERMREIKRLTE